jgi:Cellulose binding domain
MSRSRRRQGRGRVLLWIAPFAAAAAVAAVVIALPSRAVVAVRTEADSATPLEASYQTVTGWGTGYTGQYTITDAGTAAVTGWTLAFQLPDGTSVSSLWDGAYTDDGGQVTVTSDSWDATIQPGGSVSVGFVTSSAGQAGPPADCLINGSSCQAGGSAAPSATPTTVPSASASSSPPASPTP